MFHPKSTAIYSCLLLGSCLAIQVGSYAETATGDVLKCHFVGSTP